MEFGAEAVAKKFVLLGSVPVVVANWKYRLRVIVPSGILELELAQMAV